MPSVETHFEVYGMKAALAELNRVDKSLRREITKDFKSVVDPMMTYIEGQIPYDPPVSGMGRNWVTKSGFKMFPWNGSVAATMVKAKVSGKKPKTFGGYTSNLSVFYVVWQGMANTVYDMAGRRRKNKLGDSLEQEIGKASRIMYPAFHKFEPTIQQGMLDIVKKTGDAVNRRLNVVPK
jgi:hypothetical protein